MKNDKNDNVQFLNRMSEYVARFREVDLLIKEKKLDEAEIAAAKWRSDEFDSSEAWRISSIVYLDKNEIAKALTCIEIAERYCPSNDPRVLLHKAKIYTKSEQFEKAMEVYDKVLEMFAPTNLNLYVDTLIRKAEVSHKLNPECTTFHIENINNVVNNFSINLHESDQEKLDNLTNLTSTSSNKKKPKM